MRHDRLHGPTRPGTARPPRRESTRRTGLPQPHRPGQQPAVHRAHPGRHRARRAQGQPRHLRHLGEQAGLGTRQHRHHPGRRGTQGNRAHTAPQHTPPPRPRDTRCARPTPTPCRRRPPRSCCWSYDAASSPPATDATTPGTTGTAAWTRTATGPNRASSQRLTDPLPDPDGFAAPFALDTVPAPSRHAAVRNALTDRTSTPIRRWCTPVTATTPRSGPNSTG